MAKRQRESIPWKPYRGPYTTNGTTPLSGAINTNPSATITIDSNGDIAIPKTQGAADGISDTIATLNNQNPTSIPIDVNFNGLDTLAGTVMNGVTDIYSLAATSQAASALASGLSTVIGASLVANGLGGLTITNGQLNIKTDASDAVIIDSTTKALDVRIDNSTITKVNGTLHANYTLPTASTTTLGGVKIPSNNPDTGHFNGIRIQNGNILVDTEPSTGLVIFQDNKIGAAPATTTHYGVVKVDGKSITESSGILKSISSQFYGTFDLNIPGNSVAGQKLNVTAKLSSNSNGISVNASSAINTVSGGVYEVNGWILHHVATIAGSTTTGLVVVDLSGNILLECRWSFPTSFAFNPVVSNITGFFAANGSCEIYIYNSNANAALYVKEGDLSIKRIA
jgi:hypothetical protein